MATSANVDNGRATGAPVYFIFATTGLADVSNSDASPRAHFAELSAETGNNCRCALLLTEAQSQGTKVASTVACDGEAEGISEIFG